MLPSSVNGLTNTSRHLSNTVRIPRDKSTWGIFKCKAPPNSQIQPPLPSVGWEGGAGGWPLESGTWLRRAFIHEMHLFFAHATIWQWVINPLHIYIYIYIYIYVKITLLHPRLSSQKKRDRTILTDGNHRYVHYKDSVFRSKIEKCKLLSPAAGSGTSKISLVPKNTRKAGSNIRQKQALWESGLLRPGTPARY
jgi:hypothetical protein